MEELIQPARHHEREDARGLGGLVTEAVDRALWTINDRAGGSIIFNEREGGIRAHALYERDASLLHEEGLPLVAMRMRVGASNFRRHLKIESAEPVAGLPVRGQRRVQVRRQVMGRPYRVVFCANDPDPRHRGFGNKTLCVDTPTIKMRVPGIFQLGFSIRGLTIGTLAEA